VAVTPSAGSLAGGSTVMVGILINSLKTHSNKKKTKKILTVYVSGLILKNNQYVEIVDVTSKCRLYVGAPIDG
jgi:hypothetical protein